MISLTNSQGENFRREPRFKTAIILDALLMKVTLMVTECLLSLSQIGFLLSCSVLKICRGFSTSNLYLIVGINKFDARCRLMKE